MSVALISLSACIYHSPYSLPGPKLGPSFDSPESVISGDSSEWDFLWFKPVGDASANAALKKAEKKQNVNADGIVNAQVERTLYCFPLCLWPAAQFVQTRVTGTLLQNSLITPYASIKAIPNPQLLKPGQLPRPEVLESSLENIFQGSHGEAKRFYKSLNSKDQGEVRDLILTEQGRLDMHEGFFFIPADCAPNRKKFLEWFIARFTTYIPKEEEQNQWAHDLHLGIFSGE
jgi:hypothetical protein